MDYWPWTDWIPRDQEALRRLRHIAQQNDRILQLLAPEGILMSDLTAIQNAVEAAATVEDSAVTLITQLAADFAAAQNDPIAIQALVDKINSEAAALATAVAAGTAADPGTPVTPVSSDNPTAVIPAPADTSSEGMTTTESVQ